MACSGLHPQLGATVISCEDATLLFAKWRNEETPLLFQEKSALNSFAVLGILESADSDTIRFRIEGFGYIDVRCSPHIGFQYFDPASQRDTRIDALQALNLPELPATGAGMVATTPDGERFVFLEVLLA